MKSSDTQYLVEAYELIKIRQFLINEGYSNEEIDQLIAEGKVWDTLKGIGKKAGRYAALGAATAGMMGGSMAHGADTDSFERDLANKSKTELASTQKGLTDRLAAVDQENKVDMQKFDTHQSKLDSILNEIRPLVGNKMLLSTIQRNVADIRIGGKLGNKLDYPKQIEAMNKIKDVLQKTTGDMNQLNAVETVLAAYK
jgi:hypothetical protein